MTAQVAAKFRDYRWWLVGLLFVASVLNYVDRQTLSILAVTIQKSFGFGDTAYGHLLSAFLVAYTLAYAVAGGISDAVGATRSIICFVGVWSIAEILPSFLHTATQLGASRFLLGLGEAGIWVAAPKIVSDLFAPEQRAFAISLYTVGATMGAALAPPLVTGLATRYGWPSVFAITGVAGLIWIAPWWLLSRKQGVRDTYRPQPDRIPGVWLAVLRERSLWYLLLARLVTDPVWYFYLFWFPKYLEEARHQPFESVGHSIWIIYLAADFGALGGGWFAGLLIRRGIKPLRARQIWMSCMACLLPLSPLVALLPSERAVLAVAAVIAVAHMAWLVTLTALVLDVFPGAQVSSSAGWIAAGSGLGGILFSEIVAHCIAGIGYLPLFCVMGVLHPLALMLIWRVRAAPAVSFPAKYAEVPC